MLGWIYRLIGKAAANKLDLKEGQVMPGKPWWQSKALISAVLMAVVGAIQPISTALGHPITIPQWVIDILAGMGIWGIRTADKPIN